MSKCLQAARKQERFWKRYESHGLWAHWQEQSGSARFTGERPAFCAMSPKWHHLKITGRTSSFCSQYFICQKLVNAVYNMQKTSASDTKQAPHWPCICLTQVAKLNLPVSAALCNHWYSWFLSNSSESETENANRHPGYTQSGEHMLEHQAASPIFSSSCSKCQLVYFVWLYSCLLLMQNLHQLLHPTAPRNQSRDS